jgi:hydrogenase-4 component B
VGLDPQLVGDGFMSVPLILLGIAVGGVSGVPGLCFGRQSLAGQWLTTALAVGGSALGLGGVAVFVHTGAAESLTWPWSVPGGEFAVAIDGISAVFLVPVFLISLLGSVYGLGYWKQTEHTNNGRKLRLFYGILTAGMGLLLLARNAVLFLVGWEVMALAAYFLVTTEDHEPAACEAGWLYLIATHTATLFLFAAFALLRAAGGSFALAPLATAPSTATAIFYLALAGFGLKAGIMPLHVWLPSAHAIAPSHVSALMSGVIIKMGIYGIVRITSLLPAPPAEWGGVLLGLGVVSGVLGVAFAIGQHDLKRLLAYHSIENIGIIVMGLGLALLGRALGHPDWVVLGLAGALLHVWNHALFKSLLFLSAGSVIHAVHTREIDHLGGLARTMPRTALCFLVGAVAICGLPPLNGFVSEFLIYLGLFGSVVGSGDPATTRGHAGAAFAVPALALIGTLAVACFVKVFGAVFLGVARSEHASHAHESGPSMIAPMAVLVACCFVIGLAPVLVAPLLARAVSDWVPELDGAGAQLLTLAPLDVVGFMSIALFAGLLLGGGMLWALVRRGSVTAGSTWGCGFVAPTPRIQYTSSSFAEMLVALFGWALRPKVRAPEGLPLFPEKSRFQSDVPDVVLDEAILPAFRGLAWLFSLFRWFQQGSVQVYLLYIFAALLALLLWR